jgi:hypothetical protein
MSDGAEKLTTTNNRRAYIRRSLAITWSSSARA